MKKDKKRVPLYQYFTEHSDFFKFIFILRRIKKVPGFYSGHLSNAKLSIRQVVYFLYSERAMPISNPLNSANPRRRPMQEYPGFVFFFRSSII